MTTFSEQTMIEHLMGLANSPSGNSLYTLLDGTDDSTCFRDFFRLAPDAEYFPLFLNTEYESCLPLSPYIIELGPSHDDFIRDVGAKLEHDLIWITSSLPLEQLALHLQSLTQVLLESGDAVLFRYWSGQIIHNTLRQLNESERQLILPPVHQLYTPDTDGNQWKEWLIESNSLDKPSQPYPWWTLSESTLEGFSRSSTETKLNEVIDFFWRNHPEIASKIFPNLIPTFVERAISAATGLGLSNTQLQAHFCALQLTRGKDFWRDSPFAQIWNTTQTENKFRLFQNHDI